MIEASSLNFKTAELSKPVGKAGEKNYRPNLSKILGRLEANVEKNPRQTLKDISSVKEGKLIMTKNAENSPKPKTIKIGKSDQYMSWGKVRTRLLEKKAHPNVPESAPSLSLESHDEGEIIHNLVENIETVVMDGKMYLIDTDLAPNLKGFDKFNPNTDFRHSVYTHNRSDEGSKFKAIETTGGYILGTSDKDRALLKDQVVNGRYGVDETQTATMFVSHHQPQEFNKEGINVFKDDSKVVIGIDFMYGENYQGTDGRNRGLNFSVYVDMSSEDATLFLSKTLHNPVFAHKFLAELTHDESRFMEGIEETKKAIVLTKSGWLTDALSINIEQAVGRNPLEKKIHMRDFSGDSFLVSDGKTIYGNNWTQEAPIELSETQVHFINGGDLDTSRLLLHQRNGKQYETEIDEMKTLIEKGKKTFSYKKQIAKWANYAPQNIPYKDNYADTMDR